jgi:hypothetical protein
MTNLSARFTGRFLQKKKPVCYTKTNTYIGSLRGYLDIGYWKRAEYGRDFSYLQAKVGRIQQGRIVEDAV